MNFKYQPGVTVNVNAVEIIFEVVIYVPIALTVGASIVTLSSKLLF